MQSKGQAKKLLATPQSGVCVCVEHLFAKDSMIHSYTYMQGARGPLTQLAPTKLCVRWTGKRTCRSVPGCQQHSWIGHKYGKRLSQNPLHILLLCVGKTEYHVIRVSPEGGLHECVCVCV